MRFTVALLLPGKSMGEWHRWPNTFRDVREAARFAANYHATASAVPWSVQEELEPGWREAQWTEAGWL